MRNKNAKCSDPNSFVTCHGSDIHVLYDVKVMSNGELRLIPSGKESISEKINAQKQFTDMSFIISRLQMGDTSVLRDGALFGDFTRVPKSLADSLQIIIDGEKKFDRLPVEIKNKFNNSYYAWIMDSGSPAWLQKMGLLDNVKPAADPAPTSEVKE